MKILWIVNIIFPYVAQKIGIPRTSFGGWLNGLLEQIKNEDNIDIAVATEYRGNKLLEFEEQNVKYYLVPKKDIYKWKTVHEEFNPDLVHIHGTEYSYGRNYLKVNPNTKNVVSIQGLISRYSDVYLGNIDKKNIIKNITVRDIVKQDNLFQAKKKFEARGEEEKELLKKTDFVIGRTLWDYANVKAINPNIKYYIGNETLRQNFYIGEWNIDNIERHSIFVSQASYPIKGLHYLLETVYILKQKYPDVKLYVGGFNIIDNSNFKVKIKLSGYGKYIKSLMIKYKLENQVNFTGMLNEKEMKKRFLKTHVFVLPSAIENSSNSLGEAMILGMPCVASNTGGTMDIVEHKKEGYLYPYTEPAMCAEYISKFFENNELCINLGQNARQTALVRHNPKTNVEKMIEIYNIVGEIDNAK